MQYPLAIPGLGKPAGIGFTAEGALVISDSVNKVLWMYVP